MEISLLLRAIFIGIGLVGTFASAYLLVKTVELRGKMDKEGWELVFPLIVFIIVFALGCAM